jgi:hypothetical protein
MAEPKFEEYTPPQVTLKNGKTFTVKLMLELADRSYRETRQLYNLRMKTKRNQPRVLSGPRTVSTNRKSRSRYTRADAEWIVSHTTHEIMQRYQVTAHQAYAIRHYAGSLLEQQ